MKGHKYIYAVAVVASLAICAISGCRDWLGTPGKESGTIATGEQDARTLTVGIQVSPAMALVMVAEKKELFDEAGVDVEIKEFTAGKFALQAFLGNSLDMAISGDVPVALSSLQGNKFRVIAQVVDRTVNEVRVVARRDGKLDTAEEYFGAKKRKLATSIGGGPEFFTYNFLIKHKLIKDAAEMANPKGLDIISQKPEDMPAALSSGSVDAISIFDPFARIAEREMGDKGITFADSDIYSELYVCDVMQKTIDQKADLLKAFLEGLRAAQTYIEQHPEESMRVVAEYTKLEPAIVREIWPNFVFKPAINQRFLDYTMAEARWAIEKGTFPAGTPIPDFQAVLYPDLLRQVDPNAVSLP